MSKNINLCEILKDCPIRAELWSPLFGIVKFGGIEYGAIKIFTKSNRGYYFKPNGFIRLTGGISEEPMLFSSKDQRDWGKWKCPKLKFDPKTLKAFDKVLSYSFIENKGIWMCKYFSHRENDRYYFTSGSYNKCCIPYNEETKHLVGTTDKAPEFYRYWED